MFVSPLAGEKRGTRRACPMVFGFYYRVIEQAMTHLFVFYVYGDALIRSICQVALVPVSGVLQYGHTAVPGSTGAPQPGQCAGAPAAVDLGVVVPAGRTNVANSVKYSGCLLPSVTMPVVASAL
jgi:hypothetical protein